MNLILNLILILLSVNILSELGKKIKIPKVVGLIIAGLMINLPAIKNHIISANQGIILRLGDVGFVALMFLAGFEVSIELLKKEKRDALTIGLFGFFIPLIVGVLAFYLMNFGLVTSLLLGICISITAEATKAKVLLDLGKLKTKVGATLMGAGILDDVLGLTSLGLVLLFIAQSTTRETILTIIAIIAFFIGALINHKTEDDSKFMKVTEKIVAALIIPFFFISIGFHFDFNTLNLNPLLIIGITFIAIAGKIAGVLLTKSLTKFDNKQLFLIGWAMNSRGAVEFAIALILYRLNLISVEIYSAIVIMALITTLMFPFIINHIIKKYPKIMDKKNG